MVFVTPPPVPVIVMGYVPVLAVLATVRMKSAEPEPGDAIDAGLKLAVTPGGTPVAESVTPDLNEPVMVVVTTAYPLWPCSRYPALGETEMLKLADTAVTVSANGVVDVVEP